ncbi:DUF2024 family protein [Empedobacter brevis]|uniref:DUF2024 family protein n=1 Tax=Empedobacter brevis TaxID=247 RepID=UPI00289AF6F7|nr:DUF2024 family protein [Empedobacter brevis]
MKSAVWDTYVIRKDGTTMHFDIIVSEDQANAEVIYNYGREYLRSKGQEGQPLSANECRFCHIEMANPEQEADIRKKGYYIYEMENCGE